MRRLALAFCLALPLPALAQPDNEARLREALRRATVDLRAAQDAQAGLQAQLAEARAQRDQFAAANAELTARVAEAEGSAPTPEQVAENEQLRANLAAAEAQLAEFRTALTRWQAALAEAQGAAQARAAAQRAAEQGLERARGAIAAAEEKNARLVATATEILELYATPEFRSLVARSGEPLLGLWRVRLENVVQDFEDRIYDARLPRSTPAARPPAPAPAPAPARRAQ
jgi:chromosome segregation ATPase